jgi:3-hydroxyisobutyrate dehydrogenase
MSILDDRIGIVGLGHMGGGIARSAVRAGLPVTVFDLRQDVLDEFAAAGAETASSVTELAQRCGVLSMVVIDDEQVESVFHDAMKAADPPKVIIIHSTVLPTTVINLAEQAAPHGVTVIDAPVSGGSGRSARGSLSLLLGGPASIIEYCGPYFEAIGSYQFHVGDVGTGAAAKLVNNVLTLGGYALALEAMELAAAYGIDEETVATFVPVSSGDSLTIRTWGTRDRFRREHTLAGTPGVYYIQSKDLVEGVIAAGQRKLNIPLIAASAGLLPSKLQARDALLATRPEGPPIPFCDVCGQELAPPFRVHGLHPECRPW